MDQLDQETTSVEKNEIAGNNEKKDKASSQMDDERMNRNSIHCSFCGCLILRPKHAVLVDKEMEIPTIKKVDPSDSSVTPQEKLDKCWLIDSIYTFENMGFSHTVDKAKYLACAECESGPLGWMDINTDKSYLCFERVSYKP